MEFIEFRPNSPYFIELYDSEKSEYNAKNPTKSLDEDIFTVVYGYVKRRPDGFLSLGMYWWAVKDILQKRGFELAGHVESPALVDLYSVKNPDDSVHPQATMVAAFGFRDWYFEHCFEGNRDFVINDDTGDVYTLTDDGFELNRHE
jgi:hypothetical protein